ncbi:MAG: DMT family transporter [Thauera phenolivorans]|uniref:DMT family transporter n=1 Tax=Thauera phenolivorans TaxID=1792543 RepID=A0A7X7LXM7_9RHOO|nr:DMT family transporter [Thauera phenolivorans]NLF55117.1 DMT family transporter [Thauera phenolivorans]
MRLTPRLTLLLVLPPMLWAGNAVVGRIAIESIPPLWLNALRWMLAFLILLPFGWRALATAEARAQIRDRWRYLAILGLVGVGAYNALQYLALRTSTPLNVTLIASSAPVWMLAIGALFYKVMPRRLQVMGALLSLSGVALVLSRGNPGALLRIEFVEGDLLMLLAMIGWTTYSWMLARPPAHMRGEQRPAWNWAEFLVAQCVFGVGWAVGAAGIGDLVSDTAPAQWSWPLVAAVFYVAIGPSIIAYRAWGMAVNEAGPAMASIFYNFTPLFAAVFSAAVMGEWPQAYHGVAFLLIVGGILVSSRATARTSH